MYVKICKGLILVAYTIGTFFLVGDTEWGAWLCAAIALLIGAVSLNDDLAVNGSDQTPGLLWMVLFICVVGTPVFVDGLPVLLYEFGFLRSVHIPTISDVFLSIMVGGMIALYLWMPWFLYGAVEHIAAIQRLRRP